MGHVNKTYFLNLQKPPRFKKSEGEGRGQWFVDAMKLANAKGAAVARSWLRGCRIPGSKPDFTVGGPLRTKSHVVAKRHPVGVALELGERSASSGVALVI
ncbi:hypothetical protein AVEN_12741-1 [Araneus ventricosus]|uniref:Uncharacterized protein n=1 Tax=Araneus ventricosus TaxID=182803 RepID=A0A4Y2ACQ7_ARAVE|nr:hypothetical protein AVEN_12741-1 [Araneus ventricosus]